MIVAVKWTKLMPLMWTWIRPFFHPNNFSQILSLLYPKPPHPQPLVERPSPSLEVNKSGQIYTDMVPLSSHHQLMIPSKLPFYGHPNLLLHSLCLLESHRPLYCKAMSFHCSTYWFLNPDFSCHEFPPAQRILNSKALLFQVYLLHLSVRQLNDAPLLLLAEENGTFALKSLRGYRNNSMAKSCQVNMSNVSH